VAVRVSVPSCPGEGVYVTEQAADAPLPLSVHVPPLLKDPPAMGAPDMVTTPDGVMGDPAMSVTVIVQVEAVLTTSGDGEHETEVVVGCTYGRTDTA